MGEHMPSVVVINCDETYEAQELIKSVLSQSELPEPILLAEDIKAYPWHISTKYYDTDVNICFLHKKTIVNAEFAGNAQGVVIYFDGQTDSLPDVEQWLKYTDEIDAEVQILVCNVCPLKRPVQEWCIARGFELVEVNPSSEDSEDEECEDDFQETTGVPRIIQALHAVMWPNLTLKDKPNTMSEKLQKMLQSDDEKAAENNSVLEDNLLNVPDSLLEEVGEDDFSDLFSNLSEMKAKASSLPFEERKKYAEEMAIAFWKAIGGDEDELAGLGSEEDIPT